MFRITENYEFTIEFLKKDKEKLTKLLEEKDLLINKLFNEKNIQKGSTTTTDIIDLLINDTKNQIREHSKKNITTEALNIKLMNIKERIEATSKFIQEQIDLLNKEPVKLTIFENCNDNKHKDFLRTQSRLENENNDLKCRVKILESENKQMKKDLEEKIKCLNEEIVIKNKEINALNVENEALGLHLEKMIYEKSKIIEENQENEQKYKKIKASMENSINLTPNKYSNNNSIKDETQSIFEIRESKIINSMNLGEQMNINKELNKGDLHDKNDQNEKEKDYLESKNQEILNLRIDLNKMENAFQIQNGENIKLNQKLLSQTASFNALLDAKEKEINELKKSLREAEFNLREERRKINNILNKSLNGNLNVEQLTQEYQEELISENKKEKDNLSKELALLKKSLKESLDMNDILSLDLQKTKHKRTFIFFQW